jgi:hypothetical protein
MARFGRPRPPDEGFEVGHARVTSITEKSIGVEVTFGPMQGQTTEGYDCLWIPKSQIHPEHSFVDDTCLIGEEGELWVTAWLAKQKGWSAQS